MTQAGEERSLEGAGVLITGGAAGVGLETARLFARAGARVTISGRDEAKLESARQNLASEKIDVHVMVGDVSSSVDASAIVDGLVSQTGRLDVVVNNAGVILRKDGADTSDTEWRDVMAVNLDGVFYVSRAAARAMTGPGAIVNVSSTCGLVGASGLAAYCASKGAVNQLTRAMALELAPRKITVNAVAPGAINSPMLYSNHHADTRMDDVVTRNEQSIPIGAIAEPLEVARAIRFLAVESHITGTILSVDGGYTAL